MYGHELIASCLDLVADPAQIVCKMCSSAASAIRVLAVVGVIVASYALYIEYRVSLDPNYVALCDLSPEARCSRVIPPTP
jgi:hypothetical protein